MVVLIAIRTGGYGMAALTIRYDDSVHRKLKVIAAYKGISLNALMMELFDSCITEWESQNGPVRLPD
jgi:hypothetical protein